MALLLTLLYFVSTIWIFSYILSFLGLPTDELFPDLAVTAEQFFVKARI
jgi:hypothetical protein